MNDVNTLPSDGTWLRSLVRNPRFWLVMQILAIVITGFPLGLWKGELLADSYSYINVSRMPLQDAMNSTRTIGYPLILRLVSPYSPNFEIIPWIHLAMLCPVVFLLDAAIRRFGGSPWQAFAVSSGFMYSTLQMKLYIASVLTDFSGVVMAGATIAFLLLIVSRPKQFLGWIGLTVSLAACYQIRPAYLFMIFLVPCLGLLFLRIRATRTGMPFRWIQFLLAAVAVSVIPFLAFCLARFLVVGQFGLVPFGGRALSGMATELLDPALAENDLPEQYRPLAQAILKERDRRDPVNAFKGGLVVDMRQYEANYSTNMYEIAIPLARQFYGDDLAVYNHELGVFSRDVIRLRIGKYMLWAAYSFPRAVAKLIYRYWFIWFSVPLLFLLFLVRRRLQNRSSLGNSASESYDDRGLLACLTWLAILFFFANVSVLVCSGVYGDSRYAAAAGVFVPPLLALLILRELIIIRAAWHTRLTKVA